LFTMDGIDIRPLREEEGRTAVGIVCAAFGELPTEEDLRVYRLSFPLERAICAFEGGRMVATSTVISMELTLPGGSALPAAGLTWVAALPTHRRRGILRRLVAAQFADMIRRGEPLTVLLASEGNIYGRFGYGPATSHLSFSVEQPYAALATSVEDPGHITLLDTAEAIAEVPRIYESLRLKQPGMLSRTQGLWNEHFCDPPSHREGGGGMFHAKYETAPGVADGYVSYRIREDREAAIPFNRVLVVELQAADPIVYRALWDFVLNTDLCRTISFSSGRTDEPLRWLLADPRRFRVDALTDFLWLCMLDVPRALAARSYGAPGKLVFEVTDPFPVLRTSRYLLSTGPDGTEGAECVPTQAEPDLALDLGVLGTAYLGGTTFGSLAIAGRVRELREGALEEADAMFRTSVAPYCLTDF
jgi:predicted acetyltransferase